MSPFNLSSKRYLITRDFLDKMVAAKTVFGREDLSREYVEF